MPRWQGRKLPILHQGKRLKSQGIRSENFLVEVARSLWVIPQPYPKEYQNYLYAPESQKGDQEGPRVFGTLSA